MKRTYLVPLLLLLLAGLAIPLWYSVGRGGEQNEAPAAEEYLLENKLQLPDGGEAEPSLEVKGEAGTALSEKVEKAGPSPEEPSTDSPSPEQKNKPQAKKRSALKSSPSSPGQSSSVSPKKEKNEGSSADRVICTVQMKIFGQGGKLLYGPNRVDIKEGNRWGATVLGALEAADGVSYNLKEYSYGPYVESIYDLKAKGMSGWMYQVNDKKGAVGADKHALQSDDRIIWWYSESYDQPVPRWQDLP